jgi:plastocyanin
MGIMILFIAPDASVPADVCSAPTPTDVQVSDPPEGRTGAPPEFKVPLTGLDRQGNAVTIRKPPGKARRLASGARIKVEDIRFSHRNVRIDRGDELKWVFDSGELHNVTLANGPVGFGSPNLNRDNGGVPRRYDQRFDKAGTYRLFCALHPTQMTERVVVER